MKTYRFLAISICFLTIQGMPAEPPIKTTRLAENSVALIIGEDLPKTATKKWTAIQKSEVNLLHADGILRSLAELESTEAEDWRLLTRDFAAFKDAVGGSPFNGLPSVNEVVILWALQIAARGSNVVQVVKASQAQARSIETLVQGSISQGNGEVSGKLETKQSSNKDGSITMTISGGSLGGVLLAAKESARSRMQKEFLDNGFRKQMALSEVVGKWRWRWRWMEDGITVGYIIFDLRENGEMFADLQANKPSELPYDGIIKNGKGTWGLVENKLTITMTHVGKFGVYPKENLMIWIDGREVLYFDGSKILVNCEGGNRMDRINLRKQKE